LLFPWVLMLSSYLSVSPVGVFGQPLKGYAQFAELAGDGGADQPLLLAVGGEVQHAAIEEDTDGLALGVRVRKAEDLQAVAPVGCVFGLVGVGKVRLVHRFLQF